MESGLPAVPPNVGGPLRLSPFRALALAPRRVGDPSSARVFARPYRGVPQRLESWRKRGLVIREDEPAVYLHEYSDSGLTIRGLVGCLDISHPARTVEERRIFPHEGVHPRQVTELADRMATMRINPAPILLVHRGPSTIREVSRKVRTSAAERGYVDHAGQEHRIWPVTHPDHLDMIDRGLADARLLIADGHHRFAAYVALHGRDPSEALRSGLAMVIDQDETTLFLGAIHRLIRGTTWQDLLDAASRVGAHVDSIGESDAMAALAPDTLVLTDRQHWATVRLDVPDGLAMVQLVDDVLLSGLPRRPSRVGFAHSVAQALAEAGPGRATAALLPAVDLNVVVDLVATGALLPEKTTSFQPKPSLGSFIRLLDE